MRHTLKQIAFFGIDLLGVNAIFRRIHRGKIKILLYHNICNPGSPFENGVSPEHFDAQLKYLARHYNFVTLSADGQWIGISKERVNVLITFDDGFANNLTEALPLLRKYAVNACFFLITDCIPNGSAPGFAQATAHEEMSKTLNTAQASELISQGMTIGSHSRSHRKFSSLNNDHALEELTGSRSALSTLLGIKSAIFAFPWGIFLPHQLELALSQFHRIFTVEHGFNTPEDRVLNRNEVTTPLHLRAAASGSLDYFASLWRRR